MKQELIDMARQADIDHHRLWNDDGTNRLERFAKLVAAAERELKAVKQAALAQPAQRPWVGLTEQELESAYWDYMEIATQNGFEKTVKAIEAKLKEKNNG